jgi:hypothetical protein
MTLRVAICILLATISAAALSAPAYAGGFAVTTFDQLPATVRAQETYAFGYTVRQHGVTPLSGIATRIVAQSSRTGETIAFEGAPQGEPGHYVAEVHFPSDGVWQWRVEQGPFGPQQLGTVSVSAPQSVLLEGWPYARGVLAGAAILALLLFVWRVTILIRGGYRTRSDGFSTRVRSSPPPGCRNWA